MSALIWRIVIFSCLGAICALALIWLFIPANPAEPTLPDELLIQAQAREENAELDDIWQYNTDHAAQLWPDSELDSRFSALTQKEIVAGRLAHACQIAIQAPSKALRDKLLEAIFKAALADCPNVSYGVFVVRELADREKAGQLAKELERRFGECQKAAR